MFRYTLLLFICLFRIKSLIAADCSRPPRPESMMNCCVVDSMREIGRKCAMQYPFQQRGVNFCQGECVFNEAGLAVNGVIQKDQIPTMVAEFFKTTPDFIPVANDAIEKCADIAEEKMSKMKDRMPPNSDKCHPQFGFLLGCFAMETFKNCPASVWQDTDECNNAREFVASCAHHHPQRNN